MKRPFLLILALWLLLAIQVGACSRLEDDQTLPRAVATAAPIDASPSPLPTLLFVDPAAAITLPSLDEYLSHASSYRWQMAVRFEGVSDDGQPVRWQHEARYAASTSTHSWSLTWTRGQDGQQSGPGSLSAVRLGDVSYLLIPDVGCIGGAAEAVAGLLENPILPGRFLPGIGSAALISSGEAIGGVASRHYRFDEQGMVGWEDKESTVDGHLYMAEESERLVRVTMAITGRDNYLADGIPANGSLSFELDVFDINEPLTFQPPPECVESLRYPLLEGATEVTSIDDLLTYRASATLDEAVAFHQEWMPRAGWSEVGEMTVLADSAMLNFQRDGEAVFVSIEYSAADQAVIVLVSP